MARTSYILWDNDIHPELDQFAKLDIYDTLTETSVRG
jgi:hypothetical protein